MLYLTCKCLIVLYLCVLKPPTSVYLVIPIMSEPKIALIPSGCCNKILQTRSLKIKEIYSFKVMEARSLKLRCQQCYAPCEDSREESFFASISFWWQPTILGVPWLIDASLQSLPLSSHEPLACVYVYFCVFTWPSYKVTSHWL